MNVMWSGFVRQLYSWRGKARLSQERSAVEERLLVKNLNSVPGGQQWGDAPYHWSPHSHQNWGFRTKAR